MFSPVGQEKRIPQSCHPTKWRVFDASHYSTKVDRLMLVVCLVIPSSLPALWTRPWYRLCSLPHSSAPNHTNSPIAEKYPWFPILFRTVHAQIQDSSACYTQTLSHSPAPSDIHPSPASHPLSPASLVDRCRQAECPASHRPIQASSFGAETSRLYITCGLSASRVLLPNPSAERGIPIIPPHGLSRGAAAPQSVVKGDSADAGPHSALLRISLDWNSGL